MVGLPLEEAVHPPKCLKSHSSTATSSAKSLMSKGLLSPNKRRRRLLTTSSKVIMSSPTKKKKVCKGDQRHTKFLRPLVSLKPSKFLVIATDFRIPAYSKRPSKSPSDNSLSTQLAQPVILLGKKSKKMGTASRILVLFEGLGSPLGLGLGQNWQTQIAKRTPRYEEKEEHHHG